MSKILDKRLDEPCWRRCSLCEDFICNIHQEHAYDCECESVEWWAEHDMYPYETTVREYLKKMKEINND